MELFLKMSNFDEMKKKKKKKNQHQQTSNKLFTIENVSQTDKNNIFEYFNLYQIYENIKGNDNDWYDDFRKEKNSLNFSKANLLLMYFFSLSLQNSENYLINW